MRDWSSTLLPASLGGVAFHVRADEIETGRRQAVHTIPGGGHVVEEFGAAPRRHTVDAYVVGDDADLRAALLVAIAEAPGPHLMVLPSGAAMVSLDPGGMVRAFDKERLGEIVIEIRALAAGSVSAPGFGSSLAALGSPAALAATVFAAADTLFAGLGPTAAALVSGVAALGALAGGLGVAVPALIGGAVLAAATSEVVRLGGEAAIRAHVVRLSVAEAATAAEAEADLDVALAEIADAVAASVETVADLIVAPAGWVTFHTEAVRRLADLADPATWAIVARPLTSLEPDARLGVTPAARASAAAAALVPALTRIAALATVMEAVARRDWFDRRVALATRTRLTEAVALEVSRLAEMTPVPAATIADLTALRDATARFLTAAITRIAPMMTIDAATPRPALAWSWDLWGDPTRAADLAARNGVVNPGYMPTRFAAEAA